MRGSRRSDPIYLDANILIHIVEGHTRYRTILERLVLEIESGRLSAFTCELSLAEVLVRPLRDGDRQRVATFEALLAPNSPDLALIAVDRSVLLRSAAIRASLGIRLPDAIHVAAAEAVGCTVFLTEDRGLKVLPGMEAVNLAPLDRILDRDQS